MSFSLPNISRNTDTVTFTVKTNGVEVHRDHRILSVEVTREVNRIPSARLTIADGDPAAQDFSVSSSDVFVPGNEIEILAGYHSDDNTIFKGIIIKHGIKVRKSKPPLLIIECRDEVFRMSVEKRNRLFTDITDSDAISEIISEKGLSHQVENTTDIHEKIIQYNASDWDFINLRAEMNSLFVIADDGEIGIAPLNIARTPNISCAYGTNMIEFDAEIDARSQFTGATAQAWDSAEQDLVSVTNNGSVGSHPGNFNPDELAAAAGLDLMNLQHSGQITEQELTAWSNALAMRSRLAMSVGRITIRGEASIKPGMTVELQGLGDRFNGNVWISGVRHEISGGVWTTHLAFGLKLESFAQRFRENLQDVPASGLLPSVYGLQPGVVSQLEGDPKGEYRIKVKLPAIGQNDEGVWARLALPSAGENNGLVFRPEIGDEVVVGFMHDDPRNPVIIGMVHSSARQAPIEASDQNHIKVLATRSGMKIQFDDDKSVLTISTPDGNSVKIDDDNGEVVLEDSNNNSIAMNSDGITINSGKDIIMKATGDISIEGINIEQKSTAAMKLEGGAGFEASSSAIVEIKGSLVKIN